MKLYPMCRKFTFNQKQNSLFSARCLFYEKTVTAGMVGIGPLLASGCSSRPFGGDLRAQLAQGTFASETPGVPGQVSAISLWL